jgi:hypothetical protein
MSAPYEFRSWCGACEAGKASCSAAAISRASISAATRGRDSSTPTTWILPREMFPPIDPYEMGCMDALALASIETHYS